LPSCVDFIYKHIWLADANERTPVTCGPLIPKHEITGASPADWIAGFTAGTERTCSLVKDYAFGGLLFVFLLCVFFVLFF
jgi:hypothetical protein